jgi:hypothetical protein
MIVVGLQPVAGALSNVAISIIKQTEATVFVEFPGHESYETIVQTITRGDVGKAQSMFHVSLHRVDPDATASELVVERDIDIKEQFLIYAYSQLSIGPQLVLGTYIAVCLV